MAIHFRPGGALLFLPIPLRDLENTCVGVDEVWGRDGLLLHERLTETPSVVDRFALLEDFLLTRARFSTRHADVATALDAAIAADLGYFDQAHFVREFRTFAAPAALVERLGWTATVSDLAEVGNRWNGWPGPAVPMDVADVPRGYFVEATKKYGHRRHRRCPRCARRRLQC